MCLCICYLFHWFILCSRGYIEKKRLTGGWGLNKKWTLDKRKNHYFYMVYCTSLNRQNLSSNNLGDREIENIGESFQIRNNRWGLTWGLKLFNPTQHRLFRICKDWSIFNFGVSKVVWRKFLSIQWCTVYHIEVMIFSFHPKFILRGVFSKTRHGIGFHIRGLRKTFLFPMMYIMRAWQT